MNQTETAIIMSDTTQHLISMVQRRLNSRIEALNTLSTSPLDMISDEVKKMREIEAGKIRAVMQEQKDLIEIMLLLFPKPQPVKPARKSANKKNNAQN